MIVCVNMYRCIHVYMYVCVRIYIYIYIYVYPSNNHLNMYSNTTNDNTQNNIVDARGDKGYCLLFVCAFDI